MSSKITSVELKNFGLLSNFSCDNLGKVNLIIGENGTGKTFLLKALYTAIRTMEETGRGDDIRPAADIMAERLRWTFQTDKLGEIVTRGSDGALNCKVMLNSDVLEYGFSKDATKKIVSMKYWESNKPGNSVFIPAKEVLSLSSIILKSRDVDRSFGFDDTYYDLAKALRITLKRGRNLDAVSKSRKIIGEIVEGKVEFEEKSGQWIYRNKKNQKFYVGIISEGIKKVAIIDQLLANGYLGRDSIVFIDEIESALHPEAICRFLDMIALLARDMNIQFFIASHSYFVIKKLTLLAIKEKNVYKCISLKKDGTAEFNDLHDGMPSNSIIDESIKLYEQEVTEILG